MPLALSELQPILDPELLRRTAGRAESGHLSWPPTALSLDQIASEKAKGALLLDLAADAASPQAFARTLRRLADQLEAAFGQAPRVALATTGPDGSGLTRPTLAVVRSLFARARHGLLVAGFAVHQGHKIFELFAQRLDQDRKLRGRLVLNVPRPIGDTSTAASIVARFGERFKTAEWPGQRLPEVYHDPRALALRPADAASFHAKCIVADREWALVTSANPIEAAYERNIELGLTVEGGGIAATIDDWFDGLIADGHIERLPIA